MSDDVMTDRAHAADQRNSTAVKIVEESERMLTSLLMNTGPERMALNDRRVIIKVVERLRRIRRL